MCGIAGFLTGVEFDEDIGRKNVQAMAAALRQRGPDDYGVWVNSSCGIALAHRRLAVVDLTSSGHQPMVSLSGRFVLTFNGEIYNHLSMRAELGFPDSYWRGTSDTETLLAGFENWGINETLERSVGMFAFSLYDTNSRTLYLARDRFGEKPLYYGWVSDAGTGIDLKQASVFAFGSELKALRALTGFSNTICSNALEHYLRLQYVPAPYSIFSGIFKLEPGCVLIIKDKPASEAPSKPLRFGDDYSTISVRRWWNQSSIYDSLYSSTSYSKQDSVRRLHDVLAESVRLQSQADVPLGAFLSGGIDSSTIAALMQDQARANGRPPIKTFTIGFEESSFDERSYAAAVAQHLGTEHTEMLVSGSEALSAISELPQIYDEPFADSSQIPTLFLCRTARQSVTVALTGDASDELFGGYGRYFTAPKRWSKTSLIPHKVRQGMSAAVSTVPISAWNQIGSYLGINYLGDRLHRLSHVLTSLKSADDLYKNYLAAWPDPASVLSSTSFPTSTLPPILMDPLPHSISGNKSDPYSKMMWWDTQTYLPDDILCKVDRAAMSCSLETRAPFLDHRVAELAWSYPTDIKMSGDVGKLPLRQVLYRYVPKELVDRPKMGFSIPIAQWLRGPLKDWAEFYLSEDRLITQGYFDAAAVRSLWKDHLSLKRDCSSLLWSILMFQSWLDSL